MDLITKVEKRLSVIESRLSIIENNLDKSSEQLTQSSDILDSIKKVDLNLVQPSIESTIASHDKITQKERGNWLGNWLGVVAVICFVLAGVFIIKLSIDTGWLTPLRQIGIATLLGISLIFSRILLVNIDDKYSSFLPAAGIIILYLATVAAHLYYSLIPFELAIILVCMISSICIWLYMIIKHDIYSIIAAVGAYISPSLTDIGSNQIFFLYYSLVCSITFSFISVRVHSRTLTLVSVYLAIFMTGLSGLSLKQDLLVASILGLHFLIFSCGSYWYSRINNLSLTIKEANAFLPVLIMLYVMEYYFLNNIQANLAPWVSLGFAAILNLLYLSAKKYLPEAAGGEQLVSNFTIIVCFHSLYLELLPDKVHPWLLVIIPFVFAFLPFNFSKQKPQKRLYIPLIAIYLIVAIEYFSLINLFLDGRITTELLAVSFWSCLGLLAVYCNKYEQQGQPLLVAAHLLAVLGLWRLTSNIGSLAVSASWLTYAVCVMIFSYKRRDVIMIRSALFVLVLAAGKALLYDAAGTETVVRIFCLLLTGLVLYGCGALIRTTNKWT